MTLPNIEQGSLDSNSILLWVLQQMHLGYPPEVSRTFIYDKKTFRVNMEVGKK